MAFLGLTLCPVRRQRLSARAVQLGELDNRRDAVTKESEIVAKR